LAINTNINIKLPQPYSIYILVFGFTTLRNSNSLAHSTFYFYSVHVAVFQFFGNFDSFRIFPTLLSLFYSFIKIGATGRHDTVHLVYPVLSTFRGWQSLDLQMGNRYSTQIQPQLPPIQFISTQLLPLLIHYLIRQLYNNNPQGLFH